MNPSLPTRVPEWAAEAVEGGASLFRKELWDLAWT
jgi:hypothetical protein